MASSNPFEYYSDELKHAEYVYVSLEEMVNFFMQNFTGDEALLGIVPRRKVIAWMKKGIQQFSFNALREVKAVELELGDTLDIVLPHDYVNYVRISYINQTTGRLMVLSSNTKLPQAVSYLQDHEGEILFDDEGFILEGNSVLAELNDTPKTGSLQIDGCAYQGTLWKFDTTINSNGTFNIDIRTGKIHFSSDNASRIIVLEYISDGLEYSLESDIKVNKMAEIALHNWTKWNIATNKEGLQDYVVRRYEKAYIASYRNAIIKLKDISIEDTMLALNGKRKWLK